MAAFTAMVVQCSIIFASLMFAFSESWAQESVQGDHVSIRWLAPQKISAGEKTQLGFHFKPDPGWHVYWKNPGDSGAAPKFEMNSNEGSIGPIQWPFPKRLPVAHLTNLGYEGEVVYLFEFELTDRGLAKRKSAGDVAKISARLEWLVCKEDCVPGFANLNLSREITSGPASWLPADLQLIQQFAAQVPVATLSSSAFPLLEANQVGANRVRIDVRATKDRLAKIEIMPLNDLSPREPEKETVSESHHAFFFEVLPESNAVRELSFALKSDEQIWESTVPLVAVAAGEARVAISGNNFSTERLSLVLIYLFSFLGGLVLNLMPCVFPVISIKAFSFLGSPGTHLRDGILYSLGVLFTFLSLGGAFLILRGLGSQVGWGFQLQSPVVVLFLAVLFFVLALQFLDLLEAGELFTRWAGRFSGQTSSFGTGVLAVFVAAPCTGPFMGTSLGVVSILPPVQALGVFGFLGLGLATPYLLLAGVPQLGRRLPRPGEWMVVLKQFFAFPLFATVIWLLWILGQQTGSRGWLTGLLTLLSLSFCVWLWRQKVKWKFFVVWPLVVVALAWAVREVRSGSGDGPDAGISSAKAWVKFDRATFEEARQKGQAVFIDFTAAWCITCQVNKQLVLDKTETQEFFVEAGILAMRADWTKYDPDITKFLAELGRNSVPVYAFFPASGAPPRLLPQILTLQMIRDLK